jgi:hypothetical protein
MRWSEEEYQEFINKKAPKPRKKSKYRNIKTTVDGIEFDSRKEAEYYCKLKLLKQAGEIKDFGLQPRYELQPTFYKNGTTHRSITYVADFIIENNDGTTDVVDIKGVETKDFKIKKKLFEYKYRDLSLKIIK